jgi:hypothetical protein
MRIAVIALLVLALTGCAASQHRQARQHINKGEHWTAISMLQMEVQNGNWRAWNDMGVAYQRVGEPDKAIQAYTMGARWGDATAQQNLINLNAQVPPADLAAVQSQRDAANAAGAAAALQYLRATTPPPVQPPRTVNCNSYRVGNSVQTSCF